MKIITTKKMVNYKNTTLRIFLLTMLLGSLALQSRAQLTPFQSMYYSNRYLLNPALAGMDKTLNVNLNYRQQWSSFPGTPKVGSLTADFSPTEKMGLGLNINDDQSGLIRSTRVLASYAYHVPLSDRNEHLNFGLSLGFDDSRVDYSKVNGDLSDNEISAYNALKPYVDGAVGAAYTNNNLLISATLPSLESTLFKSSDSRFDADIMMFIGTIAYKFPVPNTASDLSLEPLAGYRVVKGYKNMADLGLSVAMNRYGLDMQYIYHTNQSMAAGVGFDLKTVVFTFDYNFETGPLTNYTNGAFELGLKLRLFQK
jgi:type IX secretion system PorP/SprF family membrane protein